MPATDKYNEVLIGIIAGLIVFMVITAMVVFILVFYQKKKFQHKRQISDIHEKFSEVLLKSQIEIQEQTFRHISGELHDNVGQILSLAKIQINIIKEKQEMDLDTLDDVKDNIGKALGDLRDIAKSLSSERLKNISIEDATKNEAERISKTGIIRVAVQGDGAERKIDEQKKLILFRVIQECLQNIIKHAAAAEVKIAFTYLPDLVQTCIADDGKGFDLACELKKNNGLGLANIRNRIDLVGGESKIESIPGKGTTITITIPYE